MPDFTARDVAIQGIACCVPTQKREVTDFYAQFGKEAVDDFMDMTGVRAFHYTPEEQTASDLCFVAAKRLLAHKNLAPEEIGAIVFVSQTPDYVLPATACVLHKRLGLSKDCLAFDVNLGCSGWVYGVNIAASLLSANDIARVLLLFGDTSVKTTSPEDKGSIMLFGEAGSATLIGRAAGAVLNGAYKTDGNGFKAIMMPGGAYRNRRNSKELEMCPDGIRRSDFDGYMNGTDVFSFTVTQVPKMLKSFMAREEKTPEAYDALVLHQANLFILQQISKKTKFPMEKIPLTLDRYGNTSGTSIPLTLCDAYGARAAGTVRPLMCGFGIGLSWGVLSAQLDTADILPIEETDDYYTEGGPEIG